MRVAVPLLTLLGTVLGVCASLKKTVTWKKAKCAKVQSTKLLNHKNTSVTVASLVKFARAHRNSINYVTQQTVSVSLKVRLAQKDLFFLN